MPLSSVGHESDGANQLLLATFPREDRIADLTTWTDISMCGASGAPESLADLTNTENPWLTINYIRIYTK